MASLDKDQKRAVFVDRDGVLNEMVYDETHGLMDSPRRPEQVRMIPGAGAFLRELRERGFFVSVVTNQPGIAKSTLTVAELETVNDCLSEQLGREGGSWDELRFCPHHPDGGSTPNPEYVCACQCRKPKPGMLLDAACVHGIGLGSSWMIGDGVNDIHAGIAAGCRTALVTKLKLEQVQRFSEFTDCGPDVIVTNLADAVSAICGQESV